MFELNIAGASAPKHAGGELFSNLRAEHARFSGEYTLRPYEGVVLY